MGVGNIRPTKGNFLTWNYSDLNLTRETLVKAQYGPQTKLVAHPYVNATLLDDKQRILVAEQTI